MAGKQETKLNHCMWRPIGNINVTPWVWAVLVMWLCVSAAAPPPNTPPPDGPHPSRRDPHITTQTIDSRLKRINKTLNTIITGLHPQPKQCRAMRPKQVGYRLAGGLDVQKLSTWVDDLRKHGADRTQDLIDKMTQCKTLNEAEKKDAMMVWYDMEIVRQLLEAAPPLQKNAKFLTKPKSLQKHILNKCFQRQDRKKVKSYLRDDDPFYQLLTLQPKQARQSWSGVKAQCWQRAIVNALKVIQRSMHMY